MAKIIGSKAVDPSVNIQPVLSVVSADLKNASMKAKLVRTVEPTAEKARPKIVAFHNADDVNVYEYAVYLNTFLCFDDRFHLTKSFPRALLNFELVLSALWIQAGSTAASFFTVHRRFVVGVKRINGKILQLPTNIFYSQVFKYLGDE